MTVPDPAHECGVAWLVQHGWPRLDAEVVMLRDPAARQMGVGIARVIETLCARLSELLSPGADPT